MKKVTIFILLYLFSCTTHGGVYQWTDENGHVHFGSIPPQPQDEYSLGDKIKAAQKALSLPVEKITIRVKEFTTEKVLTQQPAPVRKISPILVNKVNEKKLTRLESVEKREIEKESNKKPAAIIVKTDSDQNEKLDIHKQMVTKINIVGSTLEKSMTDEGFLVEVLTDSENLNNAKDNIKQVVEVTETEEYLVTLESESKAEQNLGVVESLMVSENIEASGRDPDKCGLFMGFVEQYSIKKSEGCPGPHCDVYERQLLKFGLKEKQYC